MAKKDADLFSMLLEGFKEAIHAGEIQVDGGADVLLESTEAFCKFARVFLRKNPPIATYIAERGLGLRLQDHTTIPLVWEEPTMQPRNAVAITMPETAPGMEGISERWSQPITKGE